MRRPCPGAGAVGRCLAIQSDLRTRDLPAIRTESGAVCIRRRLLLLLLAFLWGRGAASRMCLFGLTPPPVRRSICALLAGLELMIAATREASSIDIWIWSLVLIATVVAGFLLVSLLRRRLRQPDQTAGAGFSLDELRQLHRSGQLSDAEFERARSKLVAGLQRDARRMKP